MGKWLRKIGASLFLESSNMFCLLPRDDVDRLKVPAVRARVYGYLAFHRMPSGFRAPKQNLLAFVKQDVAASTLRERTCI
jgi:hypothetical protein